MAATAKGLWISLPHQICHKKTDLAHQSGFISAKPIWRTSRELSNHLNACTSTAKEPILNSGSNSKTENLNEKICKLCEMGNLKDALNLLSGAEKSELELSSYCLVLQLCAERKSLEGGRRVHSVILSDSLTVDDVLGAKLVFMYINCQDLVEARRIFDQIANENVFLWNLLINGYSKSGDFREGIYLYNKMKCMDVEANAYTFSCILKCFSGLGCVEEGEKAHGCLLKLGFGTQITVMNSVIAFYFRCGRLGNAQKVFDEMFERDVVSWNSMISGYASHGFAQKGLEIFGRMLHLGVVADLTTMVSSLAACADIGALMLGEMVHGYAIKACFHREMKLNNALIGMYAKCGDLSSAIKVFNNIGDKNIVSWSSMIAGYAREGRPSDAIRLFHEMMDQGTKPDTFVMTNILHACASNGLLERGRDIHEYIRKNNMLSDLSVCNALMDMYVKCGCMEDAQSVFNQLSARDTISWNTMIGGYSKNCLPNEALNMFLEMQRELKPDKITMACVLPACASLAALRRGKEIHAHVIRKGHFSDQCVANALVDMYAKCGALFLARLVFDLIPCKDLTSWTIMIAGYGMHERGDKAIFTFDQMSDAGVKPNEASFTSILCACAHSGLLDEGRKFYDIMRNDYTIEPQLEHYACMVDLLSRAGKLSEAYKFIKTMPLQPDAKIWGCLLSGCRMHHDVKLAERVADHIFELDPENTRFYVFLADLYAEAKKWEEVKKIIKKIGHRRDLGCSWIEVRGKVHIFSAGNASDPQSGKIKSLLKRLRIKMTEEGNSPKKKKYALINAEQIESEVAVCGHHETSAMAFGVLNLPRGRIIRVAKNLRICGECHELAKFMSKYCSRDIVLRDSNRFHHFKDGVCSCRGYW
ncbi:hypothetical protein Ancab_033957 [Ancistrocladus abbreviatus]